MFFLRWHHLLKMFCSVICELLNSPYAFIIITVIYKKREYFINPMTA